MEYGVIMNYKIVSALISIRNRLITLKYELNFSFNAEDRVTYKQYTEEIECLENIINKYIGDAGWSLTIDGDYTVDEISHSTECLNGEGQLYKAMECEKRLSGNLPETPLKSPTINPDVVSTVDIILNMIDGSKVERRCRNIDEVVMFLTSVGRSKDDTEDWMNVM